MNDVQIIGVGHYLPNQVWTNHDLEKSINTTDEWIFTKTGIRQRHIADPSEATSDLALYASLNAIKDANIHAEDVDLIILATSSPDMIQPSTASILQGKLGATHAAAFDIGAVCAGFVYALVTATGMMRAFPHYKNVLVVGAETYSRILNWKDRTTCVFFGDGAGAVLLSQSTKPGYLGHYLMNDGLGWDIIKFPAGGSRIPASKSSLEDGLHAFQMDGRKVWDFAIEAMPAAVREAAKDANIQVLDIDLVVPHQANINIIRRSMQALGLPMEKTYPTIEHTANTSGASIPIALSFARLAGKVKEGDIVAFVGFGGGLSWGCAIFRC
ncbi:MAG: ketoacyl-ACP synthase III [Candidatus Marinimicrobia bacterium]|nr:ketoacyl-ACP synthase III [Candidatus Neomarinimicrobiota bacterium]